MRKFTMRKPVVRNAHPDRYPLGALNARYGREYETPAGWGPQEESEGYGADPDRAPDGLVTLLWGVLLGAVGLTLIETVVGLLAWWATGRNP